MARFDSGWIKAWRKAAGSDLVGNVYLWGLWHWLLYAATWKPSKILWNGKQREIPPGTVVFGLKEIADKWKCSRMTLSKWLKYLAETDRIAYEASRNGFIVTIRNWEFYQAQEDEVVTERLHDVDAECTQRVRDVALSEEDKNTRREEEESIGGALALALPEASAGKSKSSLSQKARAELALKASTFVGAYVRAYQTRFPGRRPEDLNDGKVKGQILAWVKEYPLERACELIQVYFQLDAKWFATKGYDFLTFRNNLNVIGQALDSGQDPGGAEIDIAKIRAEREVSK